MAKDGDRVQPGRTEDFGSGARMRHARCSAPIRAGLLCVGVVALLLGCSVSRPINNEAQGAQTGGPAETPVHFQSESRRTSAVTEAVSLWKQLKDAGVATTITAYDNKGGRFTLTTTDPGRLRDVVADLRRTPGTTRRGCPEVVPAETDTAPAAQPRTGSQPRQVEAYETATRLSAGTPGEDVFSESQVRDVYVKAEERPVSYVPEPDRARSRVVAADFGPGLIVIDEIFYDPALDRITIPPHLRVGDPARDC